MCRVLYLYVCIFKYNNFQNLYIYMYVFMYILRHIKNLTPHLLYYYIILLSIGKFYKFADGKVYTTGKKCHYHRVRLRILLRYLKDR